MPLDVVDLDSVVGQLLDTRREEESQENDYQWAMTMAVRGIKKRYSFETKCPSNHRIRDTNLFST